MAMAPKKLTLSAAAVALSLFGCGGNTSTANQASTTIGAAGATLKAGAITLTIPAGAITQDTLVTLKQTEPQRGGKVRVEIEPAETQLQQPAEVAIEDDDSNVKMKMVDDASQSHPMEIEDRNHHKVKTRIDKLQALELEEEAGQACASACTSTQECDDGTCKEHTEDATKKACDGVCESGQECDDGSCKAHGTVEAEHGNNTGSTTCPPCGTGMGCDASDGIYKLQSHP